MNEFPQQKVLLSACQQLLTGWQGASAREEKQMLRAILHSLEKCGNAPPDDLLELIDVGFAMAVGDWKAYGDAWRSVVLRGLQKFFGQDHKNRFAQRISSHIGFQGMKLLENPDREQEYDTLVYILATIHDRDPRPRNRCAIRDDTIDVEITLADMTTIRAYLVNVSTDVGVGHREHSFGCEKAEPSTTITGGARRHFGSCGATAPSRLSAWRSLDRSASHHRHSACARAFLICSPRQDHN